MNRTILATVLVGAVLMAPATARAADAEFYVILGSYLLRYEDEAVANSTRVVKAANRCDIRPKIGRSSNFVGMLPGRILQVAGPYATRGRAEAMRDIARPCVPDAFVKESRYVGHEE